MSKDTGKLVAINLLFRSESDIKSLPNKIMLLPLVIKFLFKYFMISIYLYSSLFTHSHYHHSETRSAVERLEID